MFSKHNENQTSVWKENLLKTKAEKEAKERAKEERIKKMMESGEMYNKMVSETVGFITAKITEDTQKDYMLYHEKDGVVTLTIYKALVITPELHLYTGCWPVPTNPKTGKQYFFDSHRFNDEDEVKKYFQDVKAQLPECVAFEERIGGHADLVSEGARIYDVKVKIDLN